MKKTTTLILLLAITLQLSAQWTSLGHNNLSVQDQDYILGIHAPSENVFWATTLDFATFSPSQTFLKSTDGGTTITTGEVTVEDPSLTPYGIFALDDMTAWVGMASVPAQNAGNIYKTTDGGVTWVKQFEDNFSTLFSKLHFWNENEGFVYGGNGFTANNDQVRIHHTFDGGTTWTEVTPDEMAIDETFAFWTFNGLSDVQGDRAWLSTTGGRVFMSNDRGVSWQASETFAPSRMINNIAFRDSLNGIALSSMASSGAVVTNQGWQTIDGGMTWTSINVPNRPSANSLQYIPGTAATYVFIGNQNSTGMAVTTDGGKSWQQQTSPRLVGIDFISPTIGFAAGNIRNENKQGLYKFISSFEKDHINVATIAGNGFEGYDVGDALDANLYNPKGMTMDEEGNLYIANDYSHTISKITPDGEVSHIAGIPQIFSDDTDGAVDSAQFYRPQDITFDEVGNLFVADVANYKIKKINLEGDVPIVSTYAGNGETATVDSSLDSASFDSPIAIVRAKTGDFYVADFNSIRKIHVEDGIISTLAGTGIAGHADGIGAAAAFNGIWAMAIDSSDNLYVTEIFGNYVRKITPAGEVTTIAGNGGGGYQDGLGTAAQFYFPEGIAVTPDGNTIYVADGCNGFIRKIDADGLVSSIAGTEHNAYPFGPSQPGPEIIDGDGAHAVFSRSRALYLKPNGNLLHSSWGSDVIREIQFGMPSSQVMIKNDISQPFYNNHIDHIEGFSFNGIVENISDVDIKEMRLKVNVFKDGTLRFIKSSEALPITANNTEILFIEDTFVPNQAGTYDVEMTYTLEGAEHAILHDKIVVSDSLLSHDDGYVYVFADYSLYFDNFQHGYGMAYELNVADTLTGIQLLFGTFPSQFQFSVYGMNGTEVTEPIYQSDTVYFEEIYNGWYTHILEEPLGVAAGNYLITIQDFGQSFILPGFDNNIDTPYNYVLDGEEWVSVSSLFGNDITLMMRPVLGDVPNIVNVSDPNLDLVHIKVLPNPFTETLELQWTEHRQMQLILMDMNGRVLQQQQVRGTSATMEQLGDLPVGMYMLYVEGGGVRQALGVVKQ